MEELTGSRISELSTTNKLYLDDSFLISEPFSKHASRPTDFYSKSIKLSTLLSSQIDNYQDNTIFGDMAFEDENSFSKRVHTHKQYTDIDIERFYEPGDGIIKIGQVTLNSNIIDLYAPEPVIITQKTPDIGQLKFVYTTNPTVINIYSDDFDGWVYADGHEYSIEEFPHINIFPHCGEDMYCVPCLSSFIKFNPHPYSKNDMEEKYNPVIRKHTHIININLSSTIDGKIKVKESNYGTLNAVQVNNNTQTQMKIPVKIDMSGFNIKEFDYISSSDEDNRETHPTYNNVLVMVYIGKRGVV